MKRCLGSENPLQNFRRNWSILGWSIRCLHKIFNLSTLQSLCWTNPRHPGPPPEVRYLDPQTNQTPWVHLRRYSVWLDVYGTLRIRFPRQKWHHFKDPDPYGFIRPSIGLGPTGDSSFTNSSLGTAACPPSRNFTSSACEGDFTKKMYLRRDRNTQNQAGKVG